MTGDGVRSSGRVGVACLVDLARPSARRWLAGRLGALDRSRFVTHVVALGPVGHDADGDEIDAVGIGVVELEDLADSVWYPAELIDQHLIAPFVVDLIGRLDVAIVEVADGGLGLDLIPYVRADNAGVVVVVEHLGLPGGDLDERDPAQRDLDEAVGDEAVGYGALRYGHLVDAYVVASESGRRRLLELGVDDAVVEFIGVGSDSAEAASSPVHGPYGGSGRSGAGLDRDALYRTLVRRREGSR